MCALEEYVLVGNWAVRDEAAQPEWMVAPVPVVVGRRPGVDYLELEGHLPLSVMRYRRP